MFTNDGLFFDYQCDYFLKSAKLRISNGCGEGCVFCSRPLTEGSAVEYTPKDVLKTKLLELWGAGYTHVEFLDCGFLWYADVICEVLKGLQEEGMGFAFSLTAPVRALLKNQKHLMPLKKLGLRQITLGVVNSNEEVLKRYGMKFTEADQHYAIQIIQALRIQLHLQYFMFEPQTTVMDLEKGYRFLEKNRLLGLEPFGDILTSYVNLEEETPLALEYRKEKLYQLHDDPHFPYRILQPEVEEVFRWVHFFEWEFAVRWKHFYQLLLELREELARDKPGWAATNAGQELMYITLSLRMMPYELFKALLNYANTSSMKKITELEIRHQVEHKFYSLEEQYWAYRKNYNL